ncbi:hypothetical protein AC249_AIPGENE4870 [Exaiptasia diaphana]|nr:hypothetical protein AC249_AIPGENE4870 [Exaiptasia diaphana]
MPPTADRNDHPFKYHFGETHSEIDTFQPICSLNRNLKPKKHLIEPNWKELELATDDEQRDFLLKYLKDGKFEDRPVSCATTVLRPGDHLFCQGSLLGRSYEHHFLCVNVKRYGIDVIEYNGRSGTSASLASNPKAIAEIQRNYKTFEDLKKEKGWPDKKLKYALMMK